MNARSNARWVRRLASGEDRETGPPTTGDGVRALSRSHFSRAARTCSRSTIVCKKSSPVFNPAKTVNQKLQASTRFQRETNVVRCVLVHGQFQGEDMAAIAVFLLFVLPVIAGCVVAAWQSSASRKP